MSSLFHFDFPEVCVGTAENEAGPTGCTVLYFPAGVLAAADVRGGSVAGRELMGVSQTDAWAEIDALVLTGGSTWGLDTASGVMHRLLEERDGSVDFEDIPSVPAAAVYDFTGRDNCIYPDGELGIQAFDAARAGVVSVGRVGAGRHVTVGSYFGDDFAEPSGQGAAFQQFGAIKIFALCVVNAGGNVLGRDGRLVAGTKDPVTHQRSSVFQRLEQWFIEQETSRTPRKPRNTVLSVVVTNVALDRLALQRLAVMGHAAIARLIDPFHTPEDGDVVFALSTQSVALPSSASVADLGVLAGRVLQDAVLDGVERGQGSR